MKYLFSQTFIYFLPFILFSCKSNSKRDGGLCKYVTRYYPATVIKIDISDTLHIDVLFRVENAKGQLYRDSVSWYKENKDWLTQNKLDKDSVDLGRQFNYLIEEIKTGSCNPRIEKLTLNKYQKLISYEEMQEKVRKVSPN